MDKISRIVIDAEFKSLIPPLSQEEKKRLEDNCLQDGIRDELVVWANGSDLLLVDGHNRYEIAQKHGLSYKISELSFHDRNDAKIWIIRNQLGRRNLIAYDSSLLALKLKSLIAAKAEKNLHLSDGKGCQKSDKVNPIDTKKELAKLAGVSHDTIHKVEIIEKKATPEVKQKLHNKEISINKAFSDIKKVETIEAKGSDFIKERVKAGKITIDDAFKAITGTKDKTPAQMKKEFLDEKKQELKALQDSVSNPVVSVGNIKKVQKNKQILANDLYARMLHMGDGIEKIFFDAEQDGLSLNDLISEWTREEKKEMLIQINSWTQKLYMTREMISK